MQQRSRIMLVSYQWGEVCSFFHVVGILVLCISLSIHGLQLSLTPVLHYGSSVTVSQHVVGCAETITVKIPLLETKHQHTYNIPFPVCEHEFMFHNCQMTVCYYGLFLYILCLTLATGISNPDLFYCSC